jgi:hypothetical protein
MRKPKRLFRQRPSIDHGKLFRAALASVDAERHAARAAMDRAIGPIPPQIEQLRRACQIIDPSVTYSVRTPDGQVVTSTGAELVQAARLMIAMADAHEAGDESALCRAVLAFLGV